MASILLIEIETSLRRSIAHLLAGDGHDVNEARDGREGLRFLRAQRPDIILTDIIMPNADGIEIIAANRQLRQPAKLIAMSGGSGSGPDYLKAAVALGADCGLKKPFHHAELKAAIAACLGIGSLEHRYA